MSLHFTVKTIIGYTFILYPLSDRLRFPIFTPFTFIWISVTIVFVKSTSTLIFVVVGLVLERVALSVIMGTPIGATILHRASHSKKCHLRSGRLTQTWAKVVSASGLKFGIHFNNFIWVLQIFRKFRP